MNRTVHAGNEPADNLATPLRPERLPIGEFIQALARTGECIADQGEILGVQLRLVSKCPLNGLKEYPHVGFVIDIRHEPRHVFAFTHGQFGVKRSW